MRKKELSQKILENLIYRAPNPVREDLLIRNIAVNEQAQIQEVLNELVKEMKIEFRSDNVHGNPMKVYYLKSYDNIPIRFWIRIGDHDIPRMIANEIARPEDVNEIIEAFAQYANTLEDKFRDNMHEETNKYYVNTISLFGLFIGLFSLIIVASRKIELNYDWSFWDVLALNTAQVLPLAVILGVFLILIKKLFR